MGNGIPPPLAPRQEDHAIAGRVIASYPSLGYTCAELVEIARRDKLYQQLCRQIETKKAQKKPKAQELWEAEKATRRAFRAWQRLRNFKGIRARELEAMEGEKFHQMKHLAMKEASKSIRRIQAVLGIPNIGAPKIPEFQDKRLGRPLSQAAEIARILREPLVSPGTALASESPETQS